MANPNDVLNEAVPDAGSDPLFPIGTGRPLIAPGERERQHENAKVGYRLAGKSLTTATTRLAEARKKRDATAKKLHDLGMDPDEIRQGRASFSPIGMTADELQDAMKIDRQTPFLLSRRSTGIPGNGRGKWRKTDAMR